ncbi:MAG: TIGR02757 family protein [Muribaculaceae bacterium]|nr:TIGR02757 family protein [Muribaculaceae bacterium]
MKEFLDEQAALINRPEFIPEDPVQFPRRFDKLQDIEIVSLLASHIAWGKRSMICRDAERLLGLMGQDPYNYVMDEGYLDLDPSQNIHRTFFARDLQHLLTGLREIYRRYDSLDAFSDAIKAADDPAPAWKLVEEMQKIITDANGGVPSKRGLPNNLKQTALKRVNMALRWLVRDDGNVDMGVWKSIPKSKLYIPLDVHVGNTARDLGLLTRKQDDRKAVEELTSILRTYRPDDPAYYDYALFGIGVNGKEDRPMRVNV